MPQLIWETDQENTTVEDRLKIQNEIRKMMRTLNGEGQD